MKKIDKTFFVKRNLFDYQLFGKFLRRKFFSKNFDYFHRKLNKRKKFKQLFLDIINIIYNITWCSSAPLNSKLPLNKNFTIHFTFATFSVSIRSLNWPFENNTQFVMSSFEQPFPIADCFQPKTENDFLSFFFKKSSTELIRGEEREIWPYFF